ncbi:hypothetical protein [Flammeovirga aprica]|uniref:Uncharacterized protein n=1 Tax=Flammeovirga aprica JL-4 TaxID=694437 RepID=A0A7X9XDF6_9BACT|nr:hypothetical protein [Flammeovirga aprica]NME72748.1 hypothetical protein [Flammeovirga aprica JL-4]
MLINKLINEKCKFESIKKKLSTLTFDRKSTAHLETENALNIYKIRADLKAFKGKKGLYGIEKLVLNMEEYDGEKIKIIYYKAVDIQILIFSDSDEKTIIGYISSIEIEK